MISVERTLRRKKSTTSEASSVPSIRCSFSEWMISRMNTASFWTTSIFMPGGRLGMMSVSSRCWIRSTIATVLVFGTLTMPRPIAVWPLKRASWR